jgi:hypothetical protein
LLNSIFQFPVRNATPKSVYYRSVAFLFHPQQQPTYIPLALPNLLGCLALRDQPLLCFVQRSQTVALFLCHEKGS